MSVNERVNGFAVLENEIRRIFERAFASLVGDAI